MWSLYVPPYAGNKVYIGPGCTRAHHLQIIYIKPTILSDAKGYIPADQEISALKMRSKQKFRTEYCPTFPVLSVSDQDVGTLPRSLDPR